jgi:hypothetical protein
MAVEQLTFLPAAASSDHKRTVPVTKIEHKTSGFKAYAYQCSLEEDLDGAPKAYGLNNPHPVDQDHNPHTIWQAGITMLETSLANAGDPAGNCLHHLLNQKDSANNQIFRWVGLYSATQADATAHGNSIDRRSFLEARGRRVDKDDKKNVLVAFGLNEPGVFPVIQNFDGDAPGNYVSTTSAVVDGFERWDQRRYVNAVEIPYAAHASWWKTLGVELGDFGLAIRPGTGDVSGFVFGDTGTGRVGEVSRKLFEALSPERNNEDVFSFLVFPKSGVGIANRFTQNKVVQEQVKLNIRKLNNVPRSDAVVDFLGSFGADRGKYRGVLSGKGQIDTKSEEGDPVYFNVLAALISFGYQESEVDGDLVIDGQRFKAQ